MAEAMPTTTPLWMATASTVTRVCQVLSGEFQLNWVVEHTRVDVFEHRQVGGSEKPDFDRRERHLRARLCRLTRLCTNPSSDAKIGVELALDACPIHGVLSGELMCLH